MSEEMKFFMYLIEFYANYKQEPTENILHQLESKDLIQTIYDNYWGYHTEAIENAYEDIDCLIATGKHKW